MPNAKPTTIMSAAAAKPVPMAITPQRAQPHAANATQNINMPAQQTPANTLKPEAAAAAAANMPNANAIVTCMIGTARPAVVQWDVPRTLAAARRFRKPPKHH